MNYDNDTIAERDALIQEIREAFDAVDRENAISWTECYALDMHQSKEECAKARASDTDTHWSMLVNDPRWRAFPGVGGFSFIDAKGFRYYLPAAMTRFLLGDTDEYYPGHLLNVIERFVPDPVGLLTMQFAPESNRPLSERQLRAIAWFISFMGRYDRERWGPWDEETDWEDAYEARWKPFFTPSRPAPPRLPPPDEGFFPTPNG